MPVTDASFPLLTSSLQAEDYFVAQKKRSALRRYENFLRTFRFSDALAAALERHKKAPEVSRGGKLPTSFRGWLLLILIVGRLDGFPLCCFEAVLCLAITVTFWLM